MQPIVLLASLLAASLIGHLLILHRFRYQTKTLQQAHAKALEEAQKKRPLDVSAEELLRDLMASGAIVRLERIDPSQLLMWRPH